MAPRSTRRAAPRSTGSPKPSTPCATSCTARRWSGRTPTLSPPRSPYRLRGEAAVYSNVTSSFDMSARAWSGGSGIIDGAKVKPCVSLQPGESRCSVFLVQTLRPPRVFFKKQRGLGGADTSPGVQRIDGNNGDFTWLDGWTDSNIVPQELKTPSC